MSRRANSLYRLMAQRTMSTSSRAPYQRPTKVLDLPARLIPDAKFLPLQPHPSPSPKPSPPSRPSTPVPSGWTREDHVVPAAYPRTFKRSVGRNSRESTPFGVGPKGESKEDRQLRNAKQAQSILEARFSCEDGPDSTGDPGQWISAERWKKEDSEDGLILVFTHGTGFNKECWHATVRRLIDKGALDPSTTFGEPPLPLPRKSGRSASAQISEIWLIDDTFHGASVDLNKGLLGDAQCWTDTGRDVVSLLMNSLSDKQRKQRVIGIGHSFGGNALAQAVRGWPDLFEALFLVEAMCPPIYYRGEGGYGPRWSGLVHNSIKRRDRWPSLEAAKETIRLSPFYASWHPEVFDSWLAHGLVPHPEGGVQLATPAWAESCCFAEPTSLGLGWDSLADVQVPVGFLMCGDPRATSGEDNTAAMVWRPKIVANERIMDASHMVVQERPDEVADAIWRFLGTIVGCEGEGDARAKL